MRLLTEFFVVLAAVIVGLPIAREIDNRWREWLRKRRHEVIERAVIAELISRGIDVAAVNLQQLSRDIPPRATPEYIKHMVDQIEGWMRATSQQEEPPNA